MPLRWIVSRFWQQFHFKSDGVAPEALRLKMHLCIPQKWAWLHAGGLNLQFQVHPRLAMHPIKGESVGGRMLSTSFAPSVHQDYHRFLKPMPRIHVVYAYVVVWRVALPIPEVGFPSAIPFVDVISFLLPHVPPRHGGISKYHFHYFDPL